MDGARAWQLEPKIHFWQAPTPRPNPPSISVRQMLLIILPLDEKRCHCIKLIFVNNLLFFRPADVADGVDAVDVADAAVINVTRHDKIFSAVAERRATSTRSARND